MRQKATNQSEARTSRLAQVDSLLNSNYDDIPWDEITYGVETMYTAWPSISIDMQASKCRTKVIYQVLAQHLME